MRMNGTEQREIGKTWRTAKHIVVPVQMSLKRADDTPGAVGPGLCRKCVDAQLDQPCIRTRTGLRRRVDPHGLLEQSQSGGALEVASPVALRAPCATPSSAMVSFAEIGSFFISFAMLGCLPLDSKCLRVGVARHIGTQGRQPLDDVALREQQDEDGRQDRQDRPGRHDAMLDLVLLREEA